MATEATDLSRERFGFTVFLSACAHLIVILGVGFSYFDENESEAALDITLAQYRSDTAPEQADFLAQENQQGSGVAEEALAPSTPVESEFHDERIQELAAELSTPQEQSNPQAIQEVINTDQADRSIAQDPADIVQEAEQSPNEQLSPAELSLAIASLQAQLDVQRQEFANRPRKYTISSASTKKSHDALYLDSWRKRIESVGNINYPDAAREREIFGSLRMMVSINVDGGISSVEILQSSGHTILDNAAIDIVHMAAPFEPLPPEIRSQADILEIIRTWRFHEGNALSSF